MSHREPRDSDSKRHRSRLDRDPSPKRSWRDGKSAPERFPGSKDLDDRNRKDTLPLESPLPADSKLEESKAQSREHERKSNNGEHEVKKHSSNPTTEAPRPRSYSQHGDERGNDRSSGRVTTGERGWWRDSRDQRNGRTENNKNTSDNTQRRDDRAKRDESKWRHDRFFENETDDAQPTRKRPAFREKIEVEDSGQSKKAATEIVTPIQRQHHVRSAEESGKDERGRGGRYLDRTEKTFAGGGRRERLRAEFPYRERSHRDGGGNRERGERFHARPGFHSSGGGQVEKWKHDLYRESDRSPTPKNEEEQIAKLEALLSS